MCRPPFVLWRLQPLLWPQNLPPGLRDRQDQGEDNEGDVGPSSEGDGDVPLVTPVSTAEVAGPVDPDNETIYVSN